MFRRVNHASLPFLTAAIAALLLYRGMESGLGLSARTVFTFGLAGATAIAVGLALVSLTRKPRQE
jgi:hypothetical protein